MDGGYPASALRHGIHNEGDSVEDLRRNVKEAVDCSFDDIMPQPKLIRLHSVWAEVLMARKLPRAFGGAALQAAFRRLDCAFAVAGTTLPTGTKAHSPFRPAGHSTDHDQPANSP